MTEVEADDPITTKAAQYTDAQATADRLKTEFFDICAERVKASQDTAETIAARAPFTAVTIRKQLRDRGVEALPPGPKRGSRRTSA